MKRCMKIYWINGKFDFKLKLTEADKIVLDKKLLECNDTRPCEIQREVRGLKWLSYWKATEFRVTASLFLKIHYLMRFMSTSKC